MENTLLCEEITAQGRTIKELHNFVNHSTLSTAKLSASLVELESREKEECFDLRR